MRGLILLLLMIPSVAFAGEEANHFIWKIHGWYIVDFLVSVGIIWYYGRPLMRDFFKSRAESIKKALEEAQQRMDQAEKRLREYEDHLKNIRQEIEELIAAYRAKGEEEKKAILHDAHVKISYMERQAKARVELERARLQANIKRAIVQKAIDLYVDDIKKKGGMPATPKLIDAFEREMEAL